ncbi:MAG: hypothetical protein KF803_18650 [Cyclobacteriaceae bacterium]|nr:hypothetical protein [Cyclobacteriaceae bacterium]
MKTLPKFAFLMCLTIVSSCSLFEDLDDVSFDSDVTLEFYVNETEAIPGGATYVDQAVLDITSDPDVAEYADKIKDVKVNKITYLVTGLTESGVTFSNGSLMTVSNSKMIATLANLPLTESATGDFVINSEGFSQLSSKLKNLESETILLQGTLSETPIAFKVECIFNVTITANALD